MRIAPSPILLGLALLGVVASGCLEEPLKASGVFDASGAEAVFMPLPGTPFDGSGMMVMPGTMKMHIVDGDNTGIVDFEAKDMEEKVTKVHWTKFANQTGMDWQGGGVVADILEHGASGHGNKMTPLFNITVAAWGPVEANVSGTLLTDPVTGSKTLNAHLMLTKESMLEAGTFKVYKADKKTPFDPMTPGDGYVFPGRPELHFVLSGAGAFKDGIAVRKPDSVISNAADTVTSATYDKSFPIPITGVDSKIKVEASVTAGGVGQLSWSLRDPAGKVIASATTSPNAATGVLNSPAGPLQLGNYSLRVTGSGVQASYVGKITVTPPTPYLLHIVFTKVTIGAAAPVAGSKS